MANPFALTLFGSPTAHVDGQPVTGFRSSKAQALLYYLAVTGQPHMRPTLAGLLWGDQPEAAARASLSKCLSNLRELVRDAVLVERQTVAFNRKQPYHLDTERLLTGLTQPPMPETVHAWQAALAFYRGDFLEGFYVRDAPDFEQWVLVQRAHYREAVINGLHTVAHYFDQQGELPQAINHTRRLLTLEPWREEAHRQLMTQLARSGQRAAALAQFETCRRILAEELAVEPDAETLALVEVIRADKLTRGRDDQQNSGAPSRVILSSPHPVINNLPIPSTPLIGRERKLAELGTMMGNPEYRLITISGAGGAGKTRLALAAAIHYKERFAGGVAWVSLAALTNSALVAHALLQTLQQPLQGAQEPEHQLLSFLRDKAILLVMDNYEQLLPDVALVQGLLTQVGGLQLLVTSRERLALQAEHLFPLDGLSYPTAATQELPATFAAYQLFVQRARQLKPGFAPDAKTAAAIVQICQLTEGMPLALELAAGSLQTESTAVLAQTIAANHRLPVSTLRDLPARHRSIHALLEHSWQLLTAQEQQVLAQLSVFRGGFVLAAAEQVANANIETLSLLMDKSLVRSQPHDRFDLHELLRHFAGEKLKEAGRPATTYWHHLCYCLTLAKTLEAQIIGAPDEATLAHFSREHENFRAALAWGLAQPASPHPVTTTAAWLTAHLGRFWQLAKHRQDGCAWLAKALQLVEQLSSTVHADGSSWQREEIQLYARLLYRAGILESDPATSRRLLETSLQHYRTRQDPRAIARCLQELALAVSDLGEREQAKRYYSEAMTYARQINDAWCLARSLVGLSGVCLEENNPQGAIPLAQESMALYRRQQDTRGVISAMIMLAQGYLALGDYPQAAAYLEEVLELDRILTPDSKGGPWTHRILGLTEQLQGNYSRAAACYRRSLLLRQEQQQISGMAWALEGLVEVAALCGQARRATHLGGAAERLRQQVGSVISGDDLPRYEGAIRQVCLALGETQFQAAWLGGAVLALDQVIELALQD